MFIVVVYGVRSRCTPKHTWRTCGWPNPLNVRAFRTPGSAGTAIASSCARARTTRVRSRDRHGVGLFRARRSAAPVMERARKRRDRQSFELAHAVAVLADWTGVFLRQFGAPLLQQDPRRNQTQHAGVTACHGRHRESSLPRARWQDDQASGFGELPGGQCRRLIRAQARYRPWVHRGGAGVGNAIFERVPRASQRSCERGVSVGRGAVHADARIPQDPPGASHLRPLSSHCQSGAPGPRALREHPNRVIPSSPRPSSRAGTTASSRRGSRSSSASWLQTSTSCASRKQFAPARI